MALTIGDPNDPNSPTSLFPPPPARIDVTGSQTTRTKQGSSTETAAPGPEMLEAGKAREAALTDTVGVADKQLRYAKDVAEINSEKSAALVRQDERTSKARTDVQGIYQPDLDAMAAEVKRAHQDYQKYDAPRLFGNRDGWEKALLGIGLVMGAFAGAMKAKAAARMGQVSNSDPVGDIVRMDLERQREQIKSYSDKQLNAKTGLKDRNDALAVELAKVDARGAEMYKRIAQVAEMRLQNLGVPAAEIEHDATVAKAREAAAAAQTAAASGLTRRVTEHGETVSRENEARTTINTATPGGAPVKPTGEDIDKVSNLDVATENAKQLGALVAANPKDFAAVQKAIQAQAEAEKLDAAGIMGVGGKQIRALGQAVGAVDTRVEQKLATPVQREIYRRRQAELTLKAKQFGGVMTESDVLRAEAEDGGQGTAQEYTQILGDRVKQRGAQRQMYTEKRNLPAAAPATPAAAPTPATTPAPAGPQMVPIAPTPEHPKGGTGFIQPDGTREIRWN